MLVSRGTARAQTKGVPSAPAKVAGTVTDVHGTPLRRTEVRLIVFKAQVNAVRTRRDGRFSVVGTLRGRSKLAIRRIGFHPREVELRLPRDTCHALVVVLDAVDVQLTGIAESDEGSDWLGEFTERRRS